MKTPAAIVGILLATQGILVAQSSNPAPYASQVDKHLARLRSDSVSERAGGAEALGFLRAYEAQDALLGLPDDRSAVVRREAALALAWCGDRKGVTPLLEMLEDDDWTVRQTAHVSLTNLTGMEFPFDALASAPARAAQARTWRDWWGSAPKNSAPLEVLELLEGPKPWLSRWSVTASSTYKGPASVLTDGQTGPAYWQTKNVPFPQSCTIDLGETQSISNVLIHQYGPKFVMTDYELAVSTDNKTFHSVLRRKEDSPVVLKLAFPPRQARYLRIISHASIQPLYPTTFFEIKIDDKTGSTAQVDANSIWRFERGLRALGALGGSNASRTIVETLGSKPPAAPAYRPMVRAGIRALGRLHDELSFRTLIELLDDTMWARCAADALGDFGDQRAVAALLRAYPEFAKQLDGKNPPRVPRDDRMTFPSEDRMLETPYAIAYALSRLPLDHPDDRAALAKIAPLLIANLPGDHDTFMLYEPEVGHVLTRYLLNRVQLRQHACEHAFELLGQPRRVPQSEDGLEWPRFSPVRISSWLPAVCTQKQDVPRLLALLDHDDGWVRINAAKTLAWIGDPRAIDPIVAALRGAKPEAAFGYSGTFKDEEYNDPAPRWREGLIRALGQLKAHAHTTLLIECLNDERSVMDVRHAAAEALADLGSEDALTELQRAAREHPFHSIRLIARDALRYRHADEPVKNAPARHASTPAAPPVGLALQPREESFDAIVFIQGNNSIPNTIGTVEQADRWRGTYVVTDSGPVYRPGRNLFVLRPPSPDGSVTPLTKFDEGYVGDLELAWDASHAIFTYRRQNDPWWHIYRVNLDGSDLTQLTSGPYHDVGPAYLPDGRIVFASSRTGIRDEYHGYPCTALWVMDADGADLQPIAVNIGRDNEPAVLRDGRIVFSRLEVFYSRNKTELTLHAAHPDGAQDSVLYGPERRLFWRGLNHGPRTPADAQEAPLTHRVLRMTQPQPMPDGRHIVTVTQGGLTLVGPRRDRETIITPDNQTRSYTTPFPLPDGRLLCASTLKKTERKDVDLGLYRFDPASQQLELLYNDPDKAEFEPRPVMRRSRPPILPPTVDSRAYSGRFVCSSVFATQHPEVARKGRLVRLIEGVPVIARHSTQTNAHPVWKNHGGTLARVLGTAPLASDGSFNVEVPADRLLRFQILDSDRRVVGNQLTWIYARGGETRSCVGCHEDRHRAARTTRVLASENAPIDFLPNGDEFRYRAKAWFKGHLPPEIEERTRTVRAVNLLGR